MRLHHGSTALIPNVIPKDYIDMNTSTNGSSKYSSGTRPKYALIVDDDPGILDVYELALTDLGFSPILTNDGQTAMRKAQEFNPTLIILDQRMPGMTGVELVRQIRETGFTDVPIIMVSAGRHIEPEARAAGVTVCLEKPFDVDVLISTILEHTKDRALSA
jgi:DNA-binding response OmpR family regulator